MEKLFEGPNNNSYEYITVPDHITELGTSEFEEGDYNYENLSLVFERENVRPKLRSKRKQKILPWWISFKLNIFKETTDKIIIEGFSIKGEMMYCR